MKAVYITSDGKQFENKAEAKEHEAALKRETAQHEPFVGLIDFLTRALPDAPEAVEDVVAAIRADPYAFREAVESLARKLRRKRSDAGVRRGPRTPAAFAA